MKTIDKYLKRFEAYQNGDLNPAEVEVFIQALEQDSEMLDAWNEYKDMMDAFSDKEAVSLRKKLEGAFYGQQDNKVRIISQSIGFRVATAAVVIVVMGALLYFFCSSEQPFFNMAEETILIDTVDIEKVKIVTNDNLKTDTTDLITEPEELFKHEAQIASIFEKEQYQISPVFAELLNSVYRSGWFRIKTPVDSIVFFPGDSLVFSWETNIEEAMYFDILDRNGQVMYKHPSPVNSPWTFIPKLDPAIYMIRFATEDEPVWMGVIVGK
jgi:hypothetical protein